MTKQKVVTVVAGDDKTINDLIETGWLVKKMVAEHISTSTSEGYSPRTEKGKIVFLLEKEI